LLTGPARVTPCLVITLPDGEHRKKAIGDFSGAHLPCHLCGYAERVAGESQARSFIMESNKLGRNQYPPSRVSGNRMSSIDRARAREGMNQTMALGDLTLEAFKRIRSALKVVGQAVGRRIVTKGEFTMNGVDHFH
jgi:hypothetical protein